MQLFIRWKLGTSKIDCGEKFRRSRICFHSQAGIRLNGSALFLYAMIISVQKLMHFMMTMTISADDDYIWVETCTDPCGPNRSDEAASTAADDDYTRVETCTDPCDPNRSDEAASTAADDDFIRVETCTDPCGPNWCDVAASTAADDDYMKANTTGFLRIQRHNRKIIKRILKVQLK